MLINFTQDRLSCATHTYESLRSSDTSYTVDTKKWELLKNPTKIEEIQEKKIIDRN